MQALVIGDIHGCLSELKALIKDIDRTKTRIILVGDLIDRGPDSEGVIDFVRSNSIECVKGNHELMAEECLSYLKDYIDNRTARCKYLLYESNWLYNGGHDMLDQYKANSTLEKLVKDIEWLSQLPLYIKTGIKDEEDLELLVSHTWTSYRDLARANNDPDLLWNRQQPTNLKNTSKYYNVFGHTPVDYVNQNKYHRTIDPVLVPEPEFNSGTCNLDTGCVYDAQGRGWLSGVFFPSLEVKQVKRSNNA